METSEMKKLVMKRGSCKGQVTRFRTSFEGMSLTTASELDVMQLESKLSKIKLIYDEFQSVQLEIEYLNGTEDVVERDDFEKGYFEITTNAEMFVKQFNAKTAAPVANEPGEFDNISVTSNRVSENRHFSNVRLPKIDPPTFDGELSNWLSFRDLFVALIDGNNSLSEVHKLHYLRAGLKGKAAEILSSVAVTNANYRSSWELLLNRYENKRLMVQNHVSEIFEIPQIKNPSHVLLRQLLDSVIKHLRSLESVGQSVENWDTLLIHLIVSKFDTTTKKLWFESKLDNEIPKLEDIKAFITRRCEVLEAMSLNQSNQTNQPISGDKLRKRYNVATAVEDGGAAFQAKCRFCGEAHQIYYCKGFLELTLSKRREEVTKRNLCYNCLKPNHSASQCKSSRCMKCKRRHNTLIHVDGETYPTNVNINSRIIQEPESSLITDETSVLSHVESNINTQANTQVLLSTAMVIISGPDGKEFKVKALLDSGAQTSVITDRLVQNLGLPTETINTTVTGINKSVANVTCKTRCIIENIERTVRIPISCLILPRVTARLPKLNLSKALKIPLGVTLADKEFADGGEIELLVGGEVFWQIIGTHQIILHPGGPILHETKLGYILAGNIANSNTKINMLTTACVISDTGLNKQLERFWDIEHVNDQCKPYTKEEQIFENHFVQTHSRNDTGRFIVQMCFNEKISLLGESRDAALNRFHTLERKFAADPMYKEKYTAFMQEYVKLGHMSEITNTNTMGPIYHVPHHSVYKKGTNESKIRVVFDCSQKTNTGVSLNDAQLVGPTIQSDIFSIILRFRQHEFALVGDITHMYRQVIMHESCRNYQRIFWRNSKSEPIKEYTLDTIVYGQSNSPFLAIRCLFQLAKEREMGNPRVCEIIKNCMYVDDLMVSASNLRELKAIKQDIIEILNSGGFPLTKWAANNQSLLATNNESNYVPIGEKQSGKILGVTWNSGTDTLHYSFEPIVYPIQPSKRSILSIISRFYDPLGFLGPVIITGKIIMQQLWVANCNWDDTIPTNIQHEWNNYKQYLVSINEIQIPRNVIDPKAVEVELHCFSDASENAYGGVIYVRSILSNKKYVTNFLCAKSRVSPVKQLSLPRLELCGAVLLTKLYSKVKAALNISICRSYFYTDSMVVLHWIRNTRVKWKTFVANRVAVIHNITSSEQWHHIPSSLNPADIISRGMSAVELKDSKLWKFGPNFLETEEPEWPINKIQGQVIEPLEVKTITIAVGLVEGDDFNLCERYSNLNKLINIMAYILRYIHNLKPNNLRYTGDLTPTETKKSLTFLIRVVQQRVFKRELESLTTKGRVARRSNLVTLSPFLDDQGVIRVGGRLTKSSYNFDKRHPVLLPNSHAFTELIIKSEHERLLHCGAQLLLASVRENYWPVSGKNLVKKIIRNCNVCFKASPKPVQYTMADLPKARVMPSKPFSNCATDFAGPYLVKDKRIRGYKLTKMYICIFVCFATKAVHMELVADLTTDSFLAAFRRFLARRGKCLNIYSDNGTNYLGAKNELTQIYEFLNDNYSKLNEHLLKDRIHWQFAPPRSPHFNGIAESGVRAAKNHLKRVIGQTNLSIDEFSTILAQVEACLNSRPISALSNDPTDMNPLTPGHFLVGGPLMALPEEDIRAVKQSRLSRWQRVQQITQHFWQRWKLEYLHQLQQRYRWNHTTTPTPAVGELVLVKDDATPPLQWPLGRVVRHFPSEDNIVRVVEIQTVRGLFKRACTRICLLPNQ